MFEIVGTRDNFAPVMKAINDAVKKSSQSPRLMQDARKLQAKKDSRRPGRRARGLKESRAAQRRKRRKPFIVNHRPDQAPAARERGQLVLAGALARPVDGAVRLFQGHAPDVQLTATRRWIEAAPTHGRDLFPIRTVIPPDELI